MRHRKEKQFRMFLTEEEHTKIFQLAKEKGMSASEYVRYVVLYQDTIYKPVEKKQENEK